MTRLFRPIVLFALPLLPLLPSSGWTADGAPPVAPTIQAVTTEKRVALVIGNNAYALSPLKNPVNDASDIANKLRSRGFDVIERTNLKINQIGRTLREFRAKLTPGSVALIFYAGHGLQIKGENFLPAVDADIESEEDVPNQSLAVRQLLELVDEAKTRLNLIFLDACRNNPYSRRFRTAAEGLSRTPAPSGTLMSFATRPGSVASDGDGRNGLYTEHLLAAMDISNHPIEQALKRVVAGVKKASHGRQEPWMEGSIEGDFYFHQRAEIPAGSATSLSVTAQQEVVSLAVQEAVRRANEQSAKERMELQEALRRSNEQAARERMELQVSMEKMLKEALSRQNAILEAERKAREEAEQAKIPTVIVPEGTKGATNLPLSNQIASIAPAPLPTLKNVGSNMSGDEWEYISYEEKFGKRQKLVFRVKAVVPGTGILEEIEIDGRPSHEWVFGENFAVVGVPIESEFVIGPHWNGQQTASMLVSGPSLCTKASITCTVDLKNVGMEQVTVAGGTFDAIKFEGWLNALVGGFPISGPVMVWYSPQVRRLIKQTVAMNGRMFNFRTTLELSAVRAMRH